MKKEIDKAGSVSYNYNINNIITNEELAIHLFINYRYILL